MGQEPNLCWFYYNSVNYKQTITSTSFMDMLTISNYIPNFQTTFSSWMCQRWVVSLTQFRDVKFVGECNEAL